MILERLKEYIDYKGITIAKFEKSIGMSNASFGKSLKTGGAIGTDKLENILRVYPDINPIWLLKGIGEMIINDQEPDQEPEQGPDRGPDRGPEINASNTDFAIKFLSERNEKLSAENALLKDEIKRIKQQKKE